MKYLKYFLVIGFFLQGCDVENPLLRSEDALKGDEAVIVFNLYVKYPEIHNFFESIAGLEPNAYMNLELRDNTNANYYIIRTDNYK